MNYNIQKHLEEILHSGDIQTFRTEVKMALVNEIMAIEAPIGDKNKFIEFIEEFDLPIKISNQVICKQENNEIIEKSIPVLAASLSGVIFSSLLRRMPLIPASILSIGGATMIGCLVKSKMTEKGKQTTTLEQTIDTPISDIVKQIEKIIAIVKLLLKPQKVMLDKSFPNVIKWYQEAYASCDELGVECSSYFKKRIVNVLNQYYYTIHDYDGTNAKLFIKDKNIKIHNVIQKLPAITNENGYILPGSLSIPTDCKI